MREIVLDTETTGLYPATGDRVVEIGALELVNHLPTGNNFHVYINPERDMPEAAFAVHGLSEEFLKDKPVFSEITDDFINFIGHDPLIIHNAQFDVRFLNWELQLINRTEIDFDRVIDTLTLARKKHPGSPNSLDALCKRYRIDNSMRDLHGALLDSELLAGVYLELIGGRQQAFSLAEAVVEKQEVIEVAHNTIDLKRKKPLKSRLTADDLKRHDELLETLKGEKFWHQFPDARKV